MSTWCGVKGRGQGEGQGWSLIELLVVVAIVAIVALVAYPTYTEHLRRGHRVAAQVALMEAAHHLLRASVAAPAHGAGGVQQALSVPASLRNVPAVGAASYRLSATGAPPSFELQATPVGVMAQDACGTLTLNHLGDKGVQGAVRGQDVRSCWR